METLSELHAAARRYAEAGIPVFPVEVNGKKPVTPNGFYDATTDIAKIDEWWSQADYNLAMSPGQNGLLVVDLDPNYEISGELPPTYTVRTPREGFHLYYEGKGPTTASKLGRHVDTRGEGGYVLLPPSVVNGRKYTILKPLLYAPLPNWIISTLANPDRARIAITHELDLPINIERAKALLNRYVEEGNVALEGCGGDECTYRVCCELLDFGLSCEVSLELLERIWNPVCRPPWGLEELAQKLSNASEYQQNEVGSKAVEPGTKLFGSVIAGLFPQKKSRFYFKDEGEQDNEPEPKWIVKDLISERSTVLLYGPTQSYKSFIAMAIALATATGKIFAQDEPLVTGLVFYAALEGRAHLRKARKAWKVANEVDKVNNFYLGIAPMVGVPGEAQEFGEEIAKRCGEQNPKLIIIDTLGKAMAGMNENDAKDAGQFIQFCDSLVEHFGCAVIAIHHTGKDLEKGARGSSAFHAGFDTVIEVKAHRKTRALTLSVKKHKDAEERETPWTFEGQVLAGSLVFNPTSPKEHYALTNEESEYAPRKIGAALQTLNAYGQEKAITTTVLAKQITPLAEGQAESEYEHAIGRTIKILTKAAKGFLEAYTLRSGRQVLWALPEPTSKADC